MPDILPLLLRLQPVLPKTTCRQLTHIFETVLTMTGRISQKDISRWTDEGGSYRTIQRFFKTNIEWLTLNWCFFQQCVYDKNGVYLFAADETGISKSSNKTLDVNRFSRHCVIKPFRHSSDFSIALVYVGK